MCEIKSMRILRLLLMRNIRRSVLSPFMDIWALSFFTFWASFAFKQRIWIGLPNISTFFAFTLNPFTGLSKWLQYFNLREFCMKFIFIVFRMLFPSSTTVNAAYVLLCPIYNHTFIRLMIRICPRLPNSG